MSSFLDNMYARRSAFDFTDEYGMDPVQARYGTSRADVRRALADKSVELDVRSQEASILHSQLANAKLAAEENYKIRQRLETDAQLTDAYDLLGRANDLTSLTKINERFPAVQRDEGFKSAYAERKSLLENYETSRLEASKLGALDAFERKVNPPPVALGGSLDATPAEPMDPRRALAEAVDETIATSNEGVLRARGVDLPKRPDGSVDREAISALRAEMEADRLEPEERQFALDKWRMLARSVGDVHSMMNDEEKQSALQEMEALEGLLDPRKRRQRAPGAAPAPSTIPNDDYFAP
jgi:hypothetical protein